MISMSKIAALPFLAASLASSAGQSLRAAEADVPRLDVGPTCRPIDRNDAAMIDTERCLKSEKEARGQLARQWSGFPPDERALCVQTATMGSTASYVELLTCLEMKRDVARPAGRGLRNVPAGLNVKP